MIPQWLIPVLGAVYTRIPAQARPPLKRSFLWGMLRLEALTSRRRVYQGRRVEFLDFEIAHLEPNELLGPAKGEALVAALRSCISPGTERAVLCGLPGARRAFPYVPGYSMCGTVLKAGAGAPVKAGDIVVGRMPHASKGIMTSGSLFKVPAGVSPDAACFVELGIITLQGIRKAGIRPGDRVAVIGQGLIGQLASRLARLAGADPVIAVASSRKRSATALAPGAADEFVASGRDASAAQNIQADIVIEAVGSARGIVLAIEAARTGGTVVLLGSSRDLGRDLDWWALAQERSIRIVGAHITNMPRQDAALRRWTYDQEGRLFLDLLARGRLAIDDLITWRTSPADCNRVYEVIAEGGADHVGIVFEWDRLGDAASPA
jgi:2-desacetyl-2-hydroxyethyl bacteriochlorophyllide A dehydrogenase